MDGDVCGKKGCKGIIEDGYCNECGLAGAKPEVTRSSIFTAQTRPRESSHGMSNTGSSPGSRAGASGVRRSTRASSRSSRSVLGAGLIQLPELPSTDPEKQLMADPKVPEHKRFCSNCDAALSRDRGFCGKCGRKYSFLPSLKAGDVVADQYEVRGPMAYGGLGWIYLAFDRTLTRYVVLKGLLNIEDEASAAVAVAERKFLASVKHPNIVGIYNFVRHGGEGFIVMEFVNGRTLKQIRKERGPLPPAEAIAYIHRVLGAFAYLHAAGLVYCDFKPDNVMVEGNDIKLIDMGGVRRIDDPNGDIYGTIGYSAPEAGQGPTVVSDLFTIGRTLAVLVTDIPGFSRENRFTLPPAPDDPAFSKQESLYRALLKATAEHPDDRFQTADEMADQLLGVLREVAAVETGIPRPASSNLFGPDMLAFAHDSHIEPPRPSYLHLPVPSIDAADTAMRAVQNASGILDKARRVDALRAVLEQFPKSIEAKFRLSAALADNRDFAAADQLLDAAAAQDAWDWRVVWYRARNFLAAGDPVKATEQFEQAYFDLPGELAPKAGLALAAELAGTFPTAERMYDLVTRTDPNYIASLFGLARTRVAMGNRAGALEALSRVPETSGLYVQSRVEAARALIENSRAVPQPVDFEQAGNVIDKLLLDTADRLALSRQILSAALSLICAKKLPPAPQLKLLGYPLDEKALRLGLEKCLRETAKLASGADKIALVDEANRVRPGSLF